MNIKTIEAKSVNIKLEDLKPGDFFKFNVDANSGPEYSANRHMALRCDQGYMYLEGPYPCIFYKFASNASRKTANVHKYTLKEALVLYRDLS